MMESGRLSDQDEELPRFVSSLFTTWKCFDMEQDQGSTRLEARSRMMGGSVTAGPPFTSRLQRTKTQALSLAGYKHPMDYLCGCNTLVP